MGDRGNIVVRQGKTNTDDVWFYTHYSGYKLKHIVHDALAKKERWKDPSYLARIVFDEMTKDILGQTTGAGISTRMQDNSYDIVVVDVPAQKVVLVPESKLVKFRLPESLDGFESWSFTDYLTRPQTEAED